MGGSSFVSAATVDRIEIAKGPEAVLYGQGNPGGVINVVTKHPFFDKEHGTISTGYGSYQEHDLNIDVGGPLSQSIAYRLVGQYHYNEMLQDWSFQEDFVLHPAITWRVNDRVILNLRYDYFKRNTNKHQRQFHAADLGLGNIYPAPDGTPAANIDAESKGKYPIEAFGRKINLEGPYGYNHYKINTYGGDLNIKISDAITYRFAAQLALTSRVAQNRIADVLNFLPTSKTGTVSTRERYNNLYNNDQEMHNEFLFDLGHQPTKIKMLLGQESGRYVYDRLQIETPLNSGKVIPIDQIYPAEFALMLQLNGITQAQLPANSELLGTPTDDMYRLSPMSAFQNSTGNFLRTYLGSPSTTTAKVDAYYANMLAEGMNGRLHLLAGLRYEENKFDVVTYQPNFRKIFVSRADFNTKHTTYEGGAVYQIAPGLNTYASYSTSFLPNNTTDQNNVPVGPQTGKGYDIGFKESLFHDKVNGSLTYFWAERQGIPRTTFDLASATSEVHLSGLERSKGVELELFYVPTPSWNIVANATFLDGRVVSNAADPRTTGYHLPGAPRQQMNGWVTYTFMHGLVKGFTLGGGANYESATTISDSYANRNWKSDAFTIWKAYASYTTKWKSRNVTIKANVDNLFDKVYGDHNYTWGRERTWKVRMELSY